jgi:hypothetical protein
MFTNAIAENARKALEILSQSDICKNFYLAGGTAVAIQLGHRVSVDLDFFTSTKFDAEEFANSIVSRNIGASDSQDNTSQISDLQISEGTVKFQLAGAMVSYFYHPYPLLEDLIPFEKIHMAGLLDIGLMKINAIANRGSKKDFVDLYFISKAMGAVDSIGTEDYAGLNNSAGLDDSAKLDVPTGLSRIFTAFPKKYQGVQDLYHFAKALIYFADADSDTEPEPNMLVKWDWKEIKEYLIEKTQALQF